MCWHSVLVAHRLGFVKVNDLLDGIAPRNGAGRPPKQPTDCLTVDGARTQPKDVEKKLLKDILAAGRLRYYKHQVLVTLQNRPDLSSPEWVGYLQMCDFVHPDEQNKMQRTYIIRIPDLQEDVRLSPPDFAKALLAAQQAQLDPLYKDKD